MPTRTFTAYLGREPRATLSPVTELPPPSRTARLVVGVLASLALLTGAFVLALVAFFALYVGAPAWVVAVAVGAVVAGVAAALRRVRHAAARPR
ncbi:hypothetical protein NLS1_13590 [Nocardioides sp. LS1]|nr:hypothetical protein NLS1_13590 [Nocardioides sp. LS1]